MVDTPDNQRLPRRAADVPMADKKTLYQFEPFLSYDLGGSLLMGLPIMHACAYGFK